MKYGIPHIYISMTGMTSGTVSVSFKLKRDLLRRFRQAVLRKHGTLYGMIQRELNAAIEYHVVELEGGKSVV